MNLNNTHFCDRLALVIAQGGTWAGKLDSLNLSNNGIYSLKNLAQALNYHDVRIQNLALTGNKIKVLVSCRISTLVACSVHCKKLCFFFGLNTGPE